MPKKQIDENRLLKICRKCEYRRMAYNDAYYYGISRLSSRCAYLEITGEVRGCKPTDGHCDKFKQRVRSKSLVGRKEMIK